MRPAVFPGNATEDRRVVLVAHRRARTRLRMGKQSGTGRFSRGATRERGATAAGVRGRSHALGDGSLPKLAQRRAPCAARDARPVTGPAGFSRQAQARRRAPGAGLADTDNALGSARRRWTPTLRAAHHAPCETGCMIAKVDGTRSAIERTAPAIGVMTP
jgi:hypothetical protein